MTDEAEIRKGIERAEFVKKGMLSSVYSMGQKLTKSEIEALLVTFQVLLSWNTTILEGKIDFYVYPRDADDEGI